MSGFEELELEGLRSRSFGWRTRVYEETDSTNLRVLEWAAEGAPHGASCLAEAQSAGRGRQGRSWTSERRCGLFGSLLLRPERELAGVSSFSLVVAIALRRALAGLGMVEVSLKWPNDVWIGERKLAGILLEARGGESPVVVVGVGLNLRSPRAGWPEELQGRATSLQEEGATPPEATRLWTELLNQLEPCWELYGVEGFTAFQQEWRAADLLMGREVEIEEGSRRFRAWVSGVDPRGRLLTRDADGESRAHEAGEVHLDLEDLA